MEEGNSIIKSLVKGGLISASFGDLLLRDKEGSAELAAIISAAESATLKAYEEALKTKVHFYIAEDGKLFEIDLNRNKRFLRELKKYNLRLPEQFKLI